MRINTHNDQEIAFIPATDLKFAIVSNDFRYTTTLDFYKPEGRNFLKRVNKKLGTCITTNNLNETVCLPCTDYTIYEENLKQYSYIDVDITEKSLFKKIASWFQYMPDYKQELAVIRFYKDETN